MQTENKQLHDSSLSLLNNHFDTQGDNDFRNCARIGGGFRCLNNLKQSLLFNLIWRIKSPIKLFAFECSWAILYRMVQTTRILRDPYKRNPKSLKSAVIVIFKNSPCLKPEYHAISPWYFPFDPSFSWSQTRPSLSNNFGLTHALH